MEMHFRKLFFKNAGVNRVRTECQQAARLDKLSSLMSIPDETTVNSFYLSLELER